MKIIKNNRGAALVAVLIGILFIAILASSLLYMSTVNFKMKGMRQRASDNFYTDEYALSDMLAQIKQISYSSTTPRTTMKTLLQKGSSNQFDDDALEHLINTGKVPGIADVEVSCIYDNTIPSYVETANYIYLKGVKLTTTNEAGYESNIVTDIALGFPATTDAPAKVNDFSILMDSPLSIEMSSQYFGGDIYVRKNDSLGSDALRLGSKSVVTFMGNFNFFEGDITVADGAVLYLHGTTYIRGALNINGTGEVIMGGDVYCRDGVTGTYREVGTGSYKGSGGVKWENYDKYADGLCNKLFAKQMHMYYNGDDKAYTQYEYKEKFVWHHYSHPTVTGTVSVKGKDIEASARYTPFDLNGDSTISGGETYNNTMFIGYGAISKMQGVFNNCLYLDASGKGCVTIGIQAKGFAWGTMDDDHFEAARKLFVNHNGEGGYNLIGNGSNVTQLQATSNPKEFKLGGTTLVKYTNDADSKPYYYDKANKQNNYCAFDNFFDKDMNKTLREFKGAAGGDADASIQPVISVFNWTKD